MNSWPIECMHPIEFLLDLFAASGCLWIALYLFANFSVKKFIVKRYTQETNLSETKFFAEHAQFVKYLPDNLSAGFYATHLVIFAWAWNIVRFIKVKRPNVTYFDDIPNPEFVMQHFSKKEIANAKRVIVSGAIFFVHIISCIILFKTFTATA